MQYKINTLIKMMENKFYKCSKKILPSYIAIYVSK